MEICNCPPPFSMSARRLFRPRTRFCPPLATVSRSTCGLVSRKFDGESASTYWRGEKATLFSPSPRRPPTCQTRGWVGGGGGGGGGVVWWRRKGGAPSPPLRGA